MKSETIVFGGGCFWCMEAVFQMFDGVVKTQPGYAGGTTKNPTYDELAYQGNPGYHAEVLQIEYYPDKIPLEKLLDIFFKSHDPTSKNFQGVADHGTEYRSIILYSTEAQKKAVENFIKLAQKEYDKPIVTEVQKLGIFYPAEREHKDFYKKNPFNPYCVFVTRPKVNKIKKEFAVK